MAKSGKTAPRFRFAPETQFEIERVKTAPEPLESYDDREGYDPAFIDPDRPVGLPVLGKALQRDAVTHTWRGARTHLLPYTHFSTAVSKSRRLPIFSACNIDGANLRPVPRSNVWKYDPRIPEKYQILREAYGAEQKGYFSRGHMTRRQDPNWGSKKVATLADADTFHATNAAPQVQFFNGGLWGRIEDYILENADTDNMRVSVFTGPVFAQDDPVVHGVRIPVRFWKVVAFVHDETGQLAASGYLASQAKAISDLRPAFVFGDIEHQQRPLAAIEELAGLSFPDLAGRDVLAGAGVDFAAALRDVRDIMLA
ncbi:DNA/RNA endonuclease [Bordetella ansorpii]|uniref:DNA/RNA endonuclease n=1 Tax=Bordetella ansorpii TaxID=288768 RepID=A0A157S514_9BORD|nr:DNA/RNA non-specific endonuclease [Bordetella ansorpii]SAI65494.1 DNA/RNA endonuclease [Bordetella ansorpii]